MPTPLRATVPIAFAALCLLAAPGCKQATPAWARLPVPGISGDSTIAGAPAPVVHLSAPPTIDGKLDDPAWQSAAALGPLVDAGDGHAMPPDYPVAGFARIAWDEKNLYLGFVVYDKDPQTPFPATAVDPHVWGKSSGVEAMIQPGYPQDNPADNKDYYELQIDTAGAVFDSHFDDYNAPITGTGDSKTFGHQDWSARAVHAAYVQKGRFYSIEAAIPWDAFAPGRATFPPKPGDIWRLNLYSFRDGQRKALAWSPLRRQGNFHKTARFGRVQFQ